MNKIKFYDDDFNESFVDLDGYDMINVMDDNIDPAEVYTEMYDYEKSEYYVMKGYHFANVVCYWIPKPLKLTDILRYMDFDYKIKDRLFSLVDTTGANLASIEALEYEVNDECLEEYVKAMEKDKAYFAKDIKLVKCLMNPERLDISDIKKKCNEASCV